MTTRRIITIAIDDTADQHTCEAATDIIRRAISGSHILDDRVLEGPTGFGWDAETPDQPQVPLSPEDAAALMVDEGYVQVTVMVDKDQFLSAHGFGAVNGGDDGYDLVHSYAAGFGLPYAADIEIVGVSGNFFVINYCTDVRTALAETA